MLVLSAEQVTDCQASRDAEAGRETLPGILYRGWLFVKGEVFSAEEKRQAILRCRELLDQGRFCIVVADSETYTLWNKDDLARPAGEAPMPSSKAASPPAPASTSKSAPTPRPKKLLLAELAEKMQKADGLVGNHVYRLRNYPQSFVGSEAVEWLCNRLQVPRSQAVRIGQQLLEAGWIRHVTDDHSFQDAYLFYHFPSASSQPQAPVSDPAPQVTPPSGDLRPLVAKIHRTEGLIGDRRHLLRTYKQCLVGTELVDWLTAVVRIDRAAAVRLGQRLIDEGRLHHVSNERNFEDGYFFYRFYEDENIVELAVGTEESDARRARELTSTIDLKKLAAEMRRVPGLIADRRYLLKVYSNAMVGRDIVTWLSDRWRISRSEAVRLGQRLIDEKFLHHVVDEHPFKDENLFYRFYEDE